MKMKIIGSQEISIMKRKWKQLMGVQRNLTPSINYKKQQSIK